MDGYESVLHGAVELYVRQYKKMTIIPSAVIKHYKESRSLISIVRENIDSASIQAFIIDYDSEWVMLQYIYDFHLDGWLLLRIKDMSSLTCRATDAFQRHLLEKDGVLKKVDFSRQLPGGGLKELILRLPKNKIVILEDESGDDDVFLIGHVKEIVDSDIVIHEFSGAARFDDKPSTISLSDVTSVSFNTNYTLAYERYFEEEK